MLPVNNTKEYRYQGLALDQSDQQQRVDDGGDRRSPWVECGEKDDVDDMLLFIGFPSAKDPSFETRHPGQFETRLFRARCVAYFVAKKKKDPQTVTLTDQTPM